MTITIPTGELVGLINDVITFSAPDDDYPQLNCVRLEWRADHDTLHALATDKVRAAHSWWHPDDQGDGDVQDPMGVRWGGADDDWACIITRADAKEIADTFKLGAKEARTPLSVDFDRGRLVVVRSGTTGHSEHRMAVKEQFVDQPDVRDMLSVDGELVPARRAAYNAKFLADFAKVRPRGPLTLSFGKGLTLVQIGDRFAGGITPVAMLKDSPLATASGVHLSGGSDS